MKLKFLITATFAFAMMFAGNSVNAQELYNTSASQVSDVATSVSSTPLYYTQTLRRGVKNSNVLALQKRLKEMGYYTKALDADYGSGTHAAVKAYQRAKGLVADGIAGPNTFASILGVSASSLYGSKPSLTKPAVKPYVKPSLTKPGLNPTLPPVYTDGDKPTVCPALYAPVCGQQTVNCVTTPCDQPAPQTFSNACALAGAGANLLYEGTCDLTKPADSDVADSELSDIAIKKRIEALKAQIKRLENYIDDLEAKIKKLKDLL